METKLIDFALNIPQALANFGEWLMTPINAEYIPLSPLELLGISGTAIIITLIGVHVVRLFV